MTFAGPDFLVIGAQRSGTTWLHHVLKQHPDLWLPRIKELHYFDNLGAKRTWFDPREQRRWGRKIELRALLSSDPWERRFWFGKRSDAWYAELFRGAQARGLTAGEITPAYAILDESVLRRIQGMNPRIKLAFIMRDPLDRAWSAINNATKKGRLAGALTVEAALARLRSPSFAARSAYTDTINRLETVFPASQLCFSFFEELRDAPEDLAQRLLRFLGVEPGDVRSYLPARAINSAAGSKPIPAAFALEAAKEYHPMVRDLSMRFDGPPQQWLSRYEAILAGRAVSVVAS
jgi:hypothetical protein